MSVIDRPGFGQNESGELGATSWTPVTMSSEQEREMLERSISGLRQAAPRMSADHVVSTGQKLGLMVAGLLVVAGALFDPILMMQIAIGVATVVYSAAVIYRVVLVKAGLAGTDLVRVTDEEARAIADEWPIGNKSPSREPVHIHARPTPACTTRQPPSERRRGASHHRHD